MISLRNPKSVLLRALGLCTVLALVLLFIAAPAEEPETVNVLAGPLPMLVNRQYPVWEDFVPDGLVLLTDVLDPSMVRVKYPETQAVRTAAEALEEMLEAAADAGLKKCQVSAAWRSYATQESLLNAKIRSYLEKNPGWSRSRARKAALRTVAEPGCSEHHLGLAFDINVPGASVFKGTKQCKWLHAHCWEYGFIVRYPEGKEDITGFTAEAWHFRYVGVLHAEYMRDHDLCLEDYLQGIEDGTIESPAAVTVEEIDVEEIPLEEMTV